ncbi:lipid droplet-associated hydrolase [Plodia interpunctella]|uniref:lipid droplet-associated hydrolase n=1 Tax=Plodia interpunctella TaxID=58824 RepID=UPI00236766CA|nr:lipid droplet-associated hydrolase [Plodia interpunctella]XP_053608969.1 lipid droplet-associated hydrolase [Plodia interpunctella]XP_053608976.1 lipid droplet-associated hydrolase [Plodia interpunctella]
MYSEVVKTLNSVATRILTWGNPLTCAGGEVIVCISGNPGLPDFYIDFALELHKLTGLPMCVIGQAGHDVIPNEKDLVLKNQEHLYSLQGQVEHKFNFINESIDKNCRIHLIGHSIGSWMIIEMLNKHSTLIDRIVSINLLFPTIQKMAVAPNGKFITKFLSRIHVLLMFFINLIHILPQVVRSFFIDVYIYWNKLPSSYNDMVNKFLSPSSFEKMIFLAYDEMANVKELNKSGIDKIKSITNVIYSDRDGWAPVSYMEDLKQFEPHLQMTLVGVDHAFVLRSSEQVAGLVAEFIRNKT